MSCSADRRTISIYLKAVRALLFKYEENRKNIWSLPAIWLPLPPKVSKSQVNCYMSASDITLLHEKNIVTWNLWETIQRKEIEAIKSQPEMTEEEWQAFRMSHAV